MVSPRYYRCGSTYGASSYATQSVDDSPMPRAPPSYEHSWCMLAPFLEEKSSQHIKTMSDYFRKYPAPGEPSIGTFSTLDMILRLSHVSMVRNEDIFTDLIHSLRIISIPALSPLERLPNEILDQVLSYDALGPHDIISLGICSTRLWSCILASACSRILNASGNWANTPLICTHSTTKWFPDTMYELLPDLGAAQKTYQHHWPNPMVDNPSPVTTWVYHAFETFSKPVDPLQEQERWLRAFDVVSKLEFPPAWRQTAVTLRSTLMAAPRTMLPEVGEGGVLRNLTTKEYVRFQITENNGREFSAAIDGAPWLDLDAFFFLRTAWCTVANPHDPLPVTRSMRSDSERKGLWAGQCFDIVRVFDQQVSAREGWTDTTEDMAAWVAANSNIKNAKAAILYLIEWKRSKDDESKCTKDGSVLKSAHSEPCNAPADEDRLPRDQVN